MRLRYTLPLIASLSMMGCASKSKSPAAPGPQGQSAVIAPASPASATAVSSAHPKSEAAPQAMKPIMCVRETEQRKLETQNSSPSGCELWYTSYGNRHKIAWSTKAKTHCESTSERIRKNLESAGFKCGEHEEAVAAAQPAAKAPAAPAAPALHAEPAAKASASAPSAIAPAAAKAVVPAAAKPTAASAPKEEKKN